MEYKSGRLAVNWISKYSLKKNMKQVQIKRKMK